MAIERWDPFREAVSLRDAMNSLFQESFVRPAGLANGEGLASLPLDVAETEEQFVVKASLPGVAPDDVQVTVRGDTLTIRGDVRSEDEKQGERWHLRERRYGAFQRTVVLGEPVDPAKAQSHYEHGVMTLTLPKAEAARPHQIKVGAGSTRNGPEPAKK